MQRTHCLISRQSRYYSRQFVLKYSPATSFYFGARHKDSHSHNKTGKYLKQKKKGWAHFYANNDVKHIIHSCTISETNLESLSSYDWNLKALWIHHFKWFCVSQSWRNSLRRKPKHAKIACVAGVTGQDDIPDIVALLHEGSFTWHQVTTLKQLLNARFAYPAIFSSHSQKIHQRLEAPLQDTGDPSILPV